MNIKIEVRPLGDKAWQLDPGLGEALSFHSGARAEQVARSLLHRLLAAGHPAKLRIILRDGSVALATP